MKRLNIIVEGLTEMEFVKELIVPYLREHDIYAVTRIVVHTSKTTRGGFVKYEHLKNEVERLLASKKSDDTCDTNVCQNIMLHRSSIFSP